MADFFTYEDAFSGAESNKFFSYDDAFGAKTKAGSNNSRGILGAVRDYVLTTASMAGQGSMQIVSALGDTLGAPIAKTRAMMSGGAALADRLASDVTGGNPNSTLQEFAQDEAATAERTAQQNAQANPVARMALSLRDGTREQSQKLKSFDQEFNPELVRQQQEVGKAEGALGMAKALYDNPMAMYGTLVQSMPAMAGGAAVGNVAARGLGALGAATGMAPEAAAALATRGASAAGVASEAISSGGGAREGVHASIMAMPVEQLAAQSPRFAELTKAGMTPEAAREALANEVAMAVSLPTSMATAGGSMLTNKLLGDTSAKMIAGQALTAKQAAAIPLKEGAEELVQGLGEDYAQYRGMKLADRDAKYDPGASAVQNFLAGVGMSAPGAAGGVTMQKYNQARGLNPDGTQKKPGQDATVEAAPPTSDQAGTPAAGQPAGTQPANTDARTRAAGVEAIGVTGAFDYGTYDGYRTALESGGNPNARAGTSSATGLHQFIAPTWLKLVEQTQPAWAQGLSREQLLAQRTDPARSAEMVRALDRQNSNALRVAGLPVNNHTLYAAHHFGPGAAVKFARANASTPMADLLTPAQMDANAYLKGKTKGEAIANWDRRAAKAGVKFTPENIAAGEQQESTGSEIDGISEEVDSELLTPRALTDLDKVGEVDQEIAKAEARWKELDPAEGYGPTFDVERAALQHEIADLRVERDHLTQSWPKPQMGKPTSFTTETGARLEGRYAVVDASELLTSHDEYLRPNEAFPAALQPRERDRAASEMQISGIVGKLDPARLGLSADAATGAPIIGADGLVESGNARTIALKRIYQADGQKAYDYRAFLAQNAPDFGVTAEQVAAVPNPVLVRVRDTPVNRAEFARQANASTVAAMSPSEQARSDAARIDTMEDLTPDDGGDFQTSRDFIRRFMSKLPQTEQAAMVDANGALSSAGYTRVRNAVLARAYGNSPVLQRLTESLDDNQRNISRALMIAAPQVAKMRQAIDAGARHDVDITADLMAAVDELARLKDDGVSVRDALAQAGMFGDKYSPETRDFMQFLAENARRPRRIAEFIGAYFDALDAAGDPKQGSLLGDVAAPSKTELMGAARASMQGETNGDDASAASAGQKQGAEGRTGDREGGRPDREQRQAAAGREGGDQGNGAAGAQVAQPASEWAAFSPEMGSLGVPRADMPQIKAGDRSAFLQFLEARGMPYEKDAMPAGELKPTQAEFSTEKVKRFAETGMGMDRSVLVSSDGYVLDGHHQMMAHRIVGDDVPVIRIGAPIRDLLAVAEEFPSVQRSEGATAANDPVTDDLRATAVRDFKDAMADLGEWATRHQRAAIVPEDEKTLMPILVKLFDSATRIVGTDVRQAMRWVQEQLRANPDTKRLVNRIDPPMYRQAAEQALAAMGNDVEQGGLFGSPAAASAAMEDANYAPPKPVDVFDPALLQRADAYVERYYHGAKPYTMSDTERAAGERLLAPTIKLAEAAKQEFDRGVIEVAGKTGALGQMLAPIKGIGRAVEKMHQDAVMAVRPSEMRPSDVKDLLRATIVVGNYAQVQRVAEAIGDRFTITRIKEKLSPAARDASGGYADLMVTVKMPNGTMAEIQINVPAMLTAKENQGHKLFEAARALKDDDPKKAEIFSAMREIYDAAFDAASRGTLPVAVNSRQTRAAFKNAASEEGAPMRGPAGSRPGSGVSVAPSSASLNQRPSGSPTKSSPEKSATNLVPNGKDSGNFMATSDASIVGGDGLGVDGGASDKASSEGDVDAGATGGDAPSMLSATTVQAGAAGIEIAHAQALAARVRKALPSLPEVHVLTDATQAPKVLRDYIAKNGGAARGAYHDGEIYLFTDHLANMAEAEHVLATHEANHAGLDALLGPDRRRTMQALANNNDRLHRAAQRLVDEHGMGYIEAVEEVLADMAPGDLIKLRGWRRVTATVASWLADHGFTQLAEQLRGWLNGNLSQQQRADLAVAELMGAVRRHLEGRKATAPVRVKETPGDAAARKAWVSKQAQLLGFLGADDLVASNIGMFRRLEAQWRGAPTAAMARTDKTKAAYEARIDALFSGAKANLDGARVLDRSDVLSLLGLGDGPVYLAEGKVVTAKHPNMTADVWKKIPQWLDNPAAVFDSNTVAGRLVLAAPETVGNAPVLMVIEPNGQKKSDGVRVHLLQNAYDKDESAPPFGNWLRAGKGRYVDQKKFPAILHASGLQLPGTAWQNKPGTPRILTEKHLAGYRKVHPSLLSRASGERGFDASNSTLVADFRNDNPLKRHADYRAAKGGDPESAVRLVRDLVKPESLEAARKQYGAGVTFVPVHAVEASGKNAIPNALAMVYADALGASVDTDIAQSNKAFHTGAGPMERLLNRAEFDGAIEAGKSYVLVDDVTTMGSTLADLAAYIQRNGGRVAGSVVLVNAARGGKMQASPRVIKQLEARHGQAIREILGIDADQLTGPEADYLIGFKSADEIRGRAAKARQERVARLDAKALPERSPDVEPRLSRAAVPGGAPDTRTATQRADDIIQDAARTPAPLDAIAHVLTKYTGVERLTRAAYRAGGRALDRAIPERVKAGVVADYGLPEAVKDQRVLLQARQRVQLRKSGKLVDQLATLSRAESRIAYEWMNETDPQKIMRGMAALPEESVKVLQQVQQMIDKLSQDAVALGQLDPRSYERNKFAYLRRSYAKHILERPGAKQARARAVSILGDQYKGRGITESAAMAKVRQTAPEWWDVARRAGKADPDLIGRRLVKLERLVPTGAGTQALPGMPQRSDGRVLETVYLPADRARPAQYRDWRDAGTFEVRDTKGSELVLWRDYTKAEREQMGEVDEARFAIVKTLHGMIRDVETGRYLEWVAKTYGKPDGAEIDGNVIEGSERLRDTFLPGDWVRVPDTKIAGTQVAKYGKLAGKYVPGPVWNDVRSAVNGNPKPFGEFYDKVLNAWKLSKTALSPTVHVNNVMSNFVMADWHDVTAGHVAKALRIIMAAHDRKGVGAIGRAGNLAAAGIGMADREAAAEIMTRYKDSGGEMGSWVTNEIAQDQIQPLLDAMVKELAADPDSIEAQAGVMSALQLLRQGELSAAARAAAGAQGAKQVIQEGKNLIELYSNEDVVFRLAAWLKAKEQGASDIDAGKAARNAFLDYNINAPWITAMRKTGWPFLAFTYRAIPMMLEAAATKPHKLFKLMAIAGSLNALGTLLAGGDEDEEKRIRRMLPEEKAGGIWGVVPKLIRMPWNDDNGSPVFLDVRRWVPVGDVVDVGQGHSAVPMLPYLVPGGPLATIAELVLNRSQFTGKPITLDTDTAAQKTEKVAGYVYKALAPNVLGLPGSYATQGVADAAKGRTDAFGRERSVGQAIVSSVGVKVSSYPADVLQRNIVAKAKAEIGEIDKNIGQLKRQAATKAIDREEFTKEAQIEQDKKREIARKLIEKVGG